MTSNKRSKVIIYMREHASYQFIEISCPSICRNLQEPIFSNPGRAWLCVKAKIQPVPGPFIALAKINEIRLNPFRYDSNPKEGAYIS